MIGSSTKATGWLFLILGVLLVLQDLGKTELFGLSAATLFFLIVGIALAFGCSGSCSSGKTEKAKPVAARKAAPKKVAAKKKATKKRR
ncbi:MAG: hypothetical protein ACI8Y7_000044 [Candidatus Woesearchaeota archaeon]|jgi:hypothetical protein